MCSVESIGTPSFLLGNFPENKLQIRELHINRNQSQPSMFILKCLVQKPTWEEKKSIIMANFNIIYVLNWNHIQTLKYKVWLIYIYMEGSVSQKIFDRSSKDIGFSYMIYQFETLHFNFSHEQTVRQSNFL